MSTNKRKGVPRADVRRHNRRVFNQLLKDSVAEVNAHHERATVMEKIALIHGATILTKTDEEE